MAFGEIARRLVRGHSIPHGHSFADLKRWIFLFQQNKSNYAETHRAAQVQTNSAEETLELARSEQKIEHSFRAINKNWKKDFLVRN